MLALSVLQGALPALTILIGGWTADGVVRAAQGQDVHLTLLALAWAGVALLAQFSVILARLVQGHLADAFTLHTTRALMRRMHDLVGLDVLEDPAFHDDVEVLQTGAPRKPMNLVAVTLRTSAATRGTRFRQSNAAPRQAHAARRPARAP
jgi:ATP-binding cassette subfamily B protein/ATP-binding cassette subfamily C protein